MQAESLLFLRIPAGAFAFPLDDELRGLINRARCLLANRSEAQVRAAEEGLSTILSEDLSGLEEDAFEDAEQGEVEGRQLVRHSPARLLKVRINRIDIRGQPNFPSALWSEYFAVLAAQKLRSALSSAREDYEATGDASAEAQQRRLGRAFLAYMDCQEALTIAELLAAEDNARPLLNTAAGRNARSLAAVRASQTRYVKLNELKRDAIRYYLQDRTPGVAGVVRKFLGSVPRERLKECGITNPERVLRETLYAFRRGRISQAIWPPPEDQ